MKKITFFVLPIWRTKTECFCGWGKWFEGWRELVWPGVVAFIESVDRDHLWWFWQIACSPHYITVPWMVPLKANRVDQIFFVMLLLSQECSWLAPFILYFILFLGEGLFAHWRETFFHFYFSFLSFHLWPKSFDVEWIRNKSSLKKSITERIMGD